MTDSTVAEPTTSVRSIVSRLRPLLLLFVGIGLLYIVQEQVFDVLSSADRLSEIRFVWFVAMAALEFVSFVCMWILIRELLPGTSLFLIATSQLVSNSLSRTVPGGAAVGGATMYRMLSVVGISPRQAATAMATTSILSNIWLFSIPAIAAVLAVLGAPVPESLVPAAFAGALLFTLLLTVGLVVLAFPGPLKLVGDFVDGLARSLGTMMKRDWSFDSEILLDERKRLVEVLGSRGWQTLSAAAANWAFDYLALVAALFAAGAEPNLSMTLLAFVLTAVLGMIPLTPGGVGFVEVGLYSILVLSGIPAAEAGLATVAYRTVSLLLPILAGAVAWPFYKARYQVNLMGPNEPRSYSIDEPTERAA